MGSQIPADDSERFFGYARSSLTHAALQAPVEGGAFVLLNGLGTMCTGLEILSAELKATRKTLEDIKLALQTQKRGP
jgi:hypothetical protein